MLLWSRCGSRGGEVGHFVGVEDGEGGFGEVCNDGWRRVLAEMVEKLKRRELSGFALELLGFLGTQRTVRPRPCWSVVKNS